ncbi:unannotated protein [freshwater metagenome]|uniref:Unannotated protein n=1 Tax=freshwater metagenome TaxID=449393 RepID=A0A6J7MMD5_9ZZZZ
MDLDELAVRQAQDPTCLVAMKQLVTVTTLQAQTDSASHDERYRRNDEDHDSEEPGNGVDREVEGGGDDVVAATDP